MFCILCWLAPASSAKVDSKILVLGDSLSAAHNIAIEDSWPQLMTRILHQNGYPVNLVNASISGETTSGGLERLPALLAREQPDILVLELGGNDGLRGFPFKRSQQNLAEMIEMAQAKGARVLMIGVRLPTNLGPAYNRRFQQMYEAVAQQFDVNYLARFLENVAASEPDLMQADGIHPTAKAQPILADKVYRKLLPMLDSAIGK